MLMVIYLHYFIPTKKIFVRVHETIIVITHAANASFSKVASDFDPTQI